MVYDRAYIVEWLEDQAEEWDESAELWDKPGCPEAVNDRRNAILCRIAVCMLLNSKPCDSAVIEAPGQMNTTDPAPQTQPPTK